MSEDAASRPLRKDAARNRALLVQAGREVFAERGLEASLDDVARRAGLGVGTAYRHFANKYDLAKAIFADAVDGIIATARSAAAMDDPWCGIVAFIEAAAEAQTNDRGLRDVMTGVHDTGEMERINDVISPLLTDLVERAKAAGRVREEIDATDVGVAVLMLCTVADITGDVAPDLWRRYLPMLLDALRAGSPLPVPALAESEFRRAMVGHKQRMIRAPATTDPDRALVPRPR
jgi:AcrR family transcriptional regulator